MVKQVPKMSTRVVSAIRNMREVQGSTSKEILNYIKSQYHASEPTIQRQMYAALKRGLDYGILTKNNGHYSLNAGVDIPQLTLPLAPTERGRGRRRRRSSRRRRRRSRKSRRRSRRGRSRRGRRRRREIRSKRMASGRCRCSSRKTRSMQVLKDNPVEPQIQEDVIRNNDKDISNDRRSKYSKSRERSPTGSRSSTNSDQDLQDDQRTDR